MTAYTDDDVTAGAEELVKYVMEAPLDDQSDEDLVRAILAAVAPVIASRALRQACDDWPEHLPPNVTLRGWLWARAEQVNP